MDLGKCDDVEKDLQESLKWIREMNGDRTAGLRYRSPPRLTKRFMMMAASGWALLMLNFLDPEGVTSSRSPEARHKSILEDRRERGLSRIVVDSNLRSLALGHERRHLAARLAAD